MQQSKAELRRRMRQLRRGLSAQERLQAARRLAEHMHRSPLFRQARRIGCFFSADGEIDTQPLMQAAWQAGKSIYLPVLQPDGPVPLAFRLHQPDGPLQQNRYGIPEPAAGELVSVHELDLVLLPLVAFDSGGNRLGMGGGYYDRTFAALDHQAAQRPPLLGLAYAFQRLPALPVDPWDVPLTGVATEQGIQYFTRCDDKE